MLYEYLDLKPNCYGNKPGQYCDPKGKARVVGKESMSHLVDDDREDFLDAISPTPKKKKKKKKK